MKLPASAVVVCESNRTRADLYGLWLDDFAPRLALTQTQFDEAFDAGVAVTVVDHSFGDGDAATVLEQVSSEASHCRVVGIHERSTGGAESPYDHRLERPVFETDLSDRVERLFYRANYHLLLDQYYRTTVLISVYEWQTEGKPETERYERLRDRANRFQTYLNQLRPHMDDVDVHAVTKALTLTDVADVDIESAIESKYRPDKCGQCGHDWSERINGRDPAEKLGAYVWRCRNCGHVDMSGDPNHQRVSRM